MGVSVPRIIWRGESIPSVVLGTAQLGLAGYGVANQCKEVDQYRADSIVATAFACGIDYFDTAQGYGDSECKLGRAFRQCPEFAVNAKVITKLDPHCEPKNSVVIGDAIEMSFEHLGVSTLFCVMLHRFSWLAAWNSGLGAMLKRYVSDGRIRYLGASVYSPEEAMTALEHPDLDLVQIPANAWDDRMVCAGVMERARQNGKLLFLRSVYLQGLLLLDSDAAERRVPGSGRIAEEWNDWCVANNVSRLEGALAECGRLGWPMVIGMESNEQIGETVAAASLSRCTALFHGETEPQVIDPRLWP